MEKEILKKLGIKIGHYTNREDLTGATCFIAEKGAEIGIDVRGSDVGTLNVMAYMPKGADKLVKAVVLTGGSTFGLETVIGVMDYLKTPSVTGGVIFDRDVGNDSRPHIIDGYNMAKNASYTNLEQGNVGVGTGATTGKLEIERHLKGGFGFEICEIDKNEYIGAFVVTNAVGDVVNLETKEFYSKSGGYKNNFQEIFNYGKRGTNTTLAVIVTNIKMNRDELMKVAELAHDGMARAIFPVHTNFDGDIVFAISPNSENSIESKLNRFDLVNKVGLYASNILIEAINNSIINAEGIKDFPSYKDLQNGIKHKVNKLKE